MSKQSNQINVPSLMNRAGKKLLATTAMTALGLFGLSNGAHAADDWTDHTLKAGSSGSISIDTSIANETNITQIGSRVKVQGDADIKAGWTVNVAQESKSAQYILYDVEDGKSIIDGNLNANGEIFIFDRDGVIFGENSQVDVSAIIASSGTLTSTDAQLDNGQVNIAVVDGDGPVKSFGTITVGNPGEVGGLAGFVAPNVVNNGIINATMSSVTMAAGETVTLDLYGDGLVEIAVDGELEDGLIKNTGTINANGGKVVLSAAIAKDAVENVINTTGMINASSATVKGGKIILDGGSRGQVRVNGDVRANGNNGQDAGSIEIAGENVVITDDGDVRARSVFGGTANAGEITLAADSNLTIKGEVSAYGIDDTGHVYIRRTEIGSIGVGTGDGDFLVSQDEVNNITAGALTIGGDNTTIVNVEDIDMTAFKDTYLHALAASSVNFFGFNSFDNLTAVASDITLNSGSTVDALASIYFDAPIVNLDGNLEAPSISGAATTVNVNNDGNPVVGNEEIQDGVDVAGADATVNVGEGTYAQSTLINKAVNVVGAGSNKTFITPGPSANGFTIDGIIDGNVRIRNMDITGASTGIRVNDTADVNSVLIGGMRIADSVLNGVGVYGDSVGKTFIRNSNFIGNGTQTGNGRGHGDILFYLYDGDIELDNVDIQGDTAFTTYTSTSGSFDAATADYGIQIIGSNENESSSLPLRQSGSIDFDNVTVSGNYRAAQIGIQEYDGVGPVSFNDVTLGGQTNTGTDSAGWASLYLSNLGEGDINLGNTTFNGGPSDYNYIWNITGGDVDATAATFTDLADNFEIEDRVIHKMDFAPLGLVTWFADNVFVTENTAGIQHGIDISEAGDTVNIDDSTYQENLLIDKSIKLSGNGTTMEYDVDEDGPGRGGNGNIITVTVADVNIDPIIFDGLGVADYGVNADGAGAAGLVVDGNTFKNFNEAGVFVAHSGSSIGSIINNTFEGSSTRGVETGTLDGGYELNITDNIIGSDGNEVLNGLIFGQVRDATIKIKGGSIDSAGPGNVNGDGIHFKNGTYDGARVEIENVAVKADDDEAIDVQGAVRAGSTFIIKDGAYIGGNNGVEFDAIAGSVNINGTSGSPVVITGQGADKRGINMLGELSGTMYIGNADIVGGDDGIGSNEDQNNTVNGGNLFIANSKITGVNGDGIELGKVSNGSTTNFGGNEISGGDNGIHYTAGVDASTVNIASNDIDAGSNGVLFAAGSPSIEGGATVNVFDNDINADDGQGILVVDDVTGAGTSLNISGNDISASRNGIDIDNINDGANVRIGGTNSHTADYAFRADRGNIIDAGSNGIEFDAGIDSNVLIQNNRIAASEDGINVRDADNNHVTGVDNGAIVRILNNKIGSEGSDTIGDDGIDFDDSITGGSFVEISGNSIGRWNAKVGDDGIDIDSVSGANVNISNNPNIYASDNGIEISGNINNGSDINITGNNHGIHADDHGIYIGGNVFNGAEIDIHDNIISANEDNDSVGDGIHFAKNIYTANINIGDGNGSSFYSSPSNYIRGKDGIHFAGDLNSGSNLNIDGNRIGYGKTSSGYAFADRVSDDGIQILGDVQGSANVEITDNYINSNDDGVSIGDVQDDARVIIGGVNDGNTINADGNGDGVQFFGDVEDHSTVTITHNEIQADKNAVLFSGDTSNHSHKGNPEEILIAYNSLDGDENGVLFEGRASNSLHDIVIRDNLKIRGGNGNGISHEGGIDDAELSIQNNDDVSGSDNGINVKGFLFNDAKVEVSGNTDVTAKYGDGIHIEDTGYTNGSDVSVTNNHVHFTGDDGIQVIGVDGVDVKNNTIHDTGERTDNGDAISVVNSDKADVIENEISGAGRDGINVYNSDEADINYNYINAKGGNYYLGQGNAGANRDGIHVEKSDFVDIIANNITSDLGYGRYAVNQLGAGLHGIFVDGGQHADIKYNDVLGDSFLFLNVNSVGKDGIHVEENRGVDIKFNAVERAGNDGIYAYRSAYADVIGNDVSRSGGDGIDVESSFAADIKFNDVTKSEENGIEVQNSDYADIFFNEVTLSGENGIYVNPSDFVEIGFNKVFLSADDGIDVNGGHFIKIYGNLVGLNGDDGIDVDGSRHVDIFFNKTFLNRENGIDVDANHYGKHKGPNRINIVGNKAVYNGDNGIFVRGDRDVNGIELLVSKNTASDNGDNGIKILSQGEFFSEGPYKERLSVSLVSESYSPSGEFNSRIIGNTIENNGDDIAGNASVNNDDNGLYMAGGYHDNIEVSGNTFTDNEIGALFESGTIDLTGERNFFNGGEIGMKFSPAVIGEVFPEVDTIQETAFASARLISGDPVYAPMELVDNTIGAQTFDGQSELYVELDNGAFFAPGTPTLLNALDSTYLNTPFGNVTPSVDFPAGFTLEQLAFFESMFEHFNDNGNTGLFFFPLLPEIDQEDIFQFFGPNADALGGLQVTILGLPTIPGGVPTALNNIAPAAGGNVDPNSPEALNAIATAAGGDENGGSNASCFSGSALGAIQSGQAMNFSYGSSAEDLLNSEAGCSI